MSCYIHQGNFPCACGCQELVSNRRARYIQGHQRKGKKWSSELRRKLAPLSEIVSDSKICTKCKKVKSINSFYQSSKTISGRHSHCKNCRKEYSILNKDSLNLKKRIKRTTSWGRYKSYKEKAKQSQKIFLLTLEEFESITKQSCKYCGKYSQSKNYCGIDRVNNKEGYTQENCISCCNVCNWMKRDLTLEEFLSQIKSINKYYNGE